MPERNRATNRPTDRPRSFLDRAIPVFNSDIPKAPRMVLLVYCRWAIDGLHAWPGVRRVASESGLSPSTVKRARSELVERGYLRPDGFHNGGTPCYTVHPHGGRLEEGSWRTPRGSWCTPEGGHGDPQDRDRTLSDQFLRSDLVAHSDSPPVDELVSGLLNCLPTWHDSEGVSWDARLAPE